MVAYDRFRHTFDINGLNYYVILPDLYAGNGSNIAATLGLTKLGESQNVPENTIQINVSEGLKDGKFFRLRLTTRDGATGKSRSARIICPADKAKTAVGDLIGKEYRGRRITGAGVPRRRRLG